MVEDGTARQEGDAGFGRREIRGGCGGWEDEVLWLKSLLEAASL